LSDEERAVPWRAIVSSTPVRALAYVHFCNNWGFYVLLAWLPSYFTQELGVTLTNASLFTLLPPLANIAVASLVGPLADKALARGVDVTTVRKTAQGLALCGPATFMALASFHFGDDESGLLTVALITVGVSLSSFSYAGLYCNHQDMSPRFASILLGMTNTIGALPGVIGMPLTGYLLQKTENWELSMFLPAIALYFSGAAVFAKFGSGEKQAWG
jgi:cyanate permease